MRTVLEAIAGAVTSTSSARATNVVAVLRMVISSAMFFGNELRCRLPETARACFILRWGPFASIRLSPDDRALQAGCPGGEFVRGVRPAARRLRGTAPTISGRPSDRKTNAYQI